MSSYLPVLDYGTITEAAGAHPAPSSNAIYANSTIALDLLEHDILQPSPPLLLSVDQLRCTAERTTDTLEPAVGLEKSVGPKHAHSDTQEQRRSCAVYAALEAFLEHDVTSSDEMWLAASPMTGQEFHQVAEERCLAGKCGNPACRALQAQVLAEQSLGGVQRARTHCTFCSGSCEATVSGMGRRLGTEKDALDRCRASERAALAPSQLQGAVRKRFPLPPAHAILKDTVQERTVLTCNGGAQPDGAHPGLRAVTDAAIKATSSAEAALLARCVEGSDTLLLPRLSCSAAAQRMIRADAAIPSATTAHIGAEQGWGPGAPAATVSAGPPSTSQASAQYQPVSLTVKWETPAAAATGDARALLMPEMEAEDPSAGADGAPQLGHLQVLEEGVARPATGAGAAEAGQVEGAAPLQTTSPFDSDHNSDTGSSISWFSDEEEGTEVTRQHDSSWYRPPPAGVRPQISSFGALYMLLDAWVSPATRLFIENSGAEGVQAISAAPSTARWRAVVARIAVGMAAVMASLHSAVPRSQLEAQVQGLLSTLNFEASVPHLQAREWHLLALLFVRAVALNRITALQSSTEAAHTFTGTDLYLSVEEFDELFSLLHSA